MAIKNQYAGKTAEQVWNELTTGQRLHFIIDHTGKQHTESTQNEIAQTSFNFLPVTIKRELEKHINWGEYGLGGTLGKFYYNTKQAAKKGVEEAKRVGKKIKAEGTKGAKELAKEYGAAAAEGTKKALKDSLEGYKEQFEKITKKNKKKIALEVIDDTKDKVNVDRYKMTLKGAEELVEERYKEGGAVSGFKYLIYKDGEWVESTEKDFKYWYKEFGAEVMDKFGNVHKKGDIPYKDVENIYNPQGYMVAEKISIKNKGGIIDWLNKKLF